MNSSPLNAPRPPYFANRVLRLAIKTALAQHCGTDAFALLCVIALTEDARRYRGPVAFWNEQLLPLVGFAKWERLDKARQKLIDAGWLIYEPGGRHRPGLYRVTIPKDLDDVADNSVDECSTPANGYREGDQQGVETGIKGDTKRESSRVSRGGTFLPVPEPVPLPVPDKSATRFVSPTIEDVTTYCRERGNDIDPQRFLDHYTSNGWRVGKNPMRDWRAAVRNWEKNDHATPRNGNQSSIVRGQQRLNGSLGAIASFVQQDGIRPCDGGAHRLEANN